MPPKAVAPEGALDPFVTFLLQGLASTEVEIKGVDYYHLFGLNEPKNFGRKVNNYASPYGFKIDRGKISRIVDADASTKAPKSGTKRNATPAAAANDEDDAAVEESPPKKPKSAESTKPAAKGKGKGKVKAVKAESKTEEAEAENEAKTSE